MSTEAISTPLSAPTAPATTPAPERRPGVVGCVALGDLDPAPTPAGRFRRWGRRPVVAGLAGVAVASTVGAAAVRGACSTARPPRPGPLPRGGPPTPRPTRRLRQPRRELRQLGGGRISAAAEPGPTLVFPTAGEAAAGTTVTVPTILDTSDPVLHLLRRTTFGLTPELVVECTPPASTPGSQPSWSPRRCPIRRATQRGPPSPRAGRSGHDPGVGARRAPMPPTPSATRPCAQQMWSSARLFEVVVDFWANHLNVPTPGPRSWDVGGAYHRDVIRAALGSFADMLVAAGRHPAMLRYLTADRSKKDSVNENYEARAARAAHRRRGVGLHRTGRPQQPSSPAGGLRGGACRRGHLPLRPRDALGGTGDGARLQPPQPDPRGRPRRGRRLPAPPRGAPRHRPGHRGQARRAVRVRHAASGAGRPPRHGVPRGRDGHRPGARPPVPVRRVLGGGRAEDPPARRERGPCVRILGTVPEGDPVRSIAGLANVACEAGHKAIAWPAPNGYPDVNAAWRSATGLLTCWNLHRMLISDWEDGLSRPDPVAMAGGAATANARRQPLCPHLLPGVPARPSRRTGGLPRGRPGRPGRERPGERRPRPRARLALLRPPVSSDMTRPTDHRCGPDPDGPGELRRLGPTPGDGAVRACAATVAADAAAHRDAWTGGCRAVRS